MFKVEINDEAVNAQLAQIATRIDDMSPLMASIGEILVASTKRRFGQGISPEGAKWAPKSPTTLAKYGARKSNRVDVRPLFGPSGMLNTQIYSRPDRNEVEIGSPRVYAAMMQFGGTKAQFPHLWGNIPARPFLGVSVEDRTAILEEIAEYLALAIAK